MDDYSAWVIGPPAEENTKMIQDEVVPMLEKWYRAAGRDSTTPLRFKWKDVVPTDKVKVLGMAIDKEARFKIQPADKTGKATKVIRDASAIRQASCTGHSCGNRG